MTRLWQTLSAHAKQIGLWLLIALGLVLTGCASGSVRSTFCLIATPIYIHPSDVLSERTAVAILEHNERGAALCGW